MSDPLLTAVRKYIKLRDEADAHLTEMFTDLPDDHRPTKFVRQDETNRIVRALKAALSDLRFHANA